MTKLLPHQAAVVHEIKRKLPLAALYAPLGTGKTLAGITAAFQAGHKKVLVMSDKTSCIRTWPREVHKHFGLDTLNLPDVRRKKKKTLPTSSLCVYLAGYDWVKFNQDWVKHWASSNGVHSWIGDQSECFKDHRSWRSKALKDVVSVIPHRLIMSAIPVGEAHLEEIFGQMLVLDQGKALGTSMYHFHREYFYPHSMGYGWLPKPGALDKLRVKLAPYVVNIPPALMPLMPSKAYQVKELQKSALNEEQRTLLSQLKDEFRLVIDGDEQRLNYAVQVFMKLRQVVGGTVRYKERGVVRLPIEFNMKLNYLDRLISNSLKDEKIVIWCAFRGEVGLLKDYLPRRGHPIRWLTGEKSKVERDVTLGNFAASKRNQILILTHGFARSINDLTDAGHAIFYSLPLSFTTYAEAEARTCRLLGTPTRYHHIIVHGTPDSHIYRQLRRKKSFAVTVDGFRAMLEEEE